MSKQVRLRRGTTAQHSSFTGTQGEVTVDTDKKVVVVHDGSTAGGVPMFPSTGGTISGNVGIGGASASAPLVVRGTTDGNIWVRAASAAASGLTGVGLSGINNAASALCDVAIQGANINFVIDNAVVGKCDSAGNLLVGATSGNHHTLSKAGASDYATTIINTSGTTPYGQRIILSAVTGGTGAGFLSCQDDAERFRVLGNGNVQNVNNSYGAISDANLKRDWVPTGPKLNKILTMNIVNYYLKADPTNTKLLGVIAQELREISPGLVEETPDYETVEKTPARVDILTKTRQVILTEDITSEEIQLIDGQYRKIEVTRSVDVPQFETVNLYSETGEQLRDTNGNPLMHQVPVMEEYTEEVHYPAIMETRLTGEVTLSVKYSILVPMLVKAMQEMHEDFNRRLQALEN